MILSSIGKIRKLDYKYKNMIKIIIIKKENKASVTIKWENQELDIDFLYINFMQIIVS